MPVDYTPPSKVYVAGIVIRIELPLDRNGQPTCIVDPEKQQLLEDTITNLVGVCSFTPAPDRPGYLVTCVLGHGITEAEYVEAIERIWAGCSVDVK